MKYAGKNTVLRGFHIGCAAVQSRTAVTTFSIGFNSLTELLQRRCITQIGLYLTSVTTVIVFTLIHCPCDRK